MLAGDDLLQLVLELGHVPVWPRRRRRRSLFRPRLPRRRLEIIPDLLVVTLPDIIQFEVKKWYASVIQICCTMALKLLA